MRIIDLEPFVNGRSYTRVIKAPYRGSIELFNYIYGLVKQGVTSEKNLNIYELPSQYYEAEPDIKNFVPSIAREEIFYALKNGYISEKVPAKCIYYVRKAFNVYGIPNLIFKVIPSTEVTIMCQQNYLAENFTLRDVVCSFCDDRYTPLSASALKTSWGDYSEVYIQETDMVAVLPSSIANPLSHEDIKSIKVDSYGLKIGDRYLKFLAGFNGACDSYYDLRHLI